MCLPEPVFFLGKSECLRKLKACPARGEAENGV